MRLIDAEALWNKIGHITGVCSSPKSAFHNILAAIHFAPAVDAVEVVHGRWEDVGDNISDLCFRCSACKEEYSVEINMNTFARYCPNCGAKMDGERSEE